MKLKFSYKFYIVMILCLGFVAWGFTPEGAFGVNEAQAAAAKKTAKKIVDPTDPRSSIYLDTAGKLAGTGDSRRPPSKAYQSGRGWHPAALEGEGLPRDRFGLVDWAQLVKKDLIAPKGSLDPADTSEMPPLDLDIIIKAKSDFVKDVKYPHWMHTYWLKCEVCHATVGGAIFIPAKGQNNMTMVGIARGEWCGRCHDKVAFPLADCNRCHTVPRKK